MQRKKLQHSYLFPNFGFFFDIDGVIVRGQNVLPSALKSFKRLIAPSKEFRVPTVFITNDGNMLRRDKAAHLTKWLEIDVHEDQIILSHSPLSMMTGLEHNRILVSGQGKIEEIAIDLGLKNIVTMETLIHNFPSLNYVNKNKRNPVNGPVDRNFKKIDGIILLNEPTNWETSLQLIVDLLLTNGMPCKHFPITPYPHIFVMACNMDLLWMAEAPLPRYGHGAFLLCLEKLYEKISGQKLMYTAIAGKPSILTYRYANIFIQKHAQKIGIPRTIETIYAVGDNINTDVCGANLYNRYLTVPEKLNGQHIQMNRDESNMNQAKKCVSVLVETGVHHSSFNYSKQHSHRDFMKIEENMFKPNIITNDVRSAIDTVFQLEAFK
ncbi:haloacid dehalogenase-like hydrolase domain-containing 5 isoform X2 [Nasonia vitripennis]|uniref:Uncharacterized protein n=1 Tax=Nasonia vitripennis TaxID=7425 RepID=A0A7M7QKS7_NASVI|nr:haloacid dehalogenase-like hydrolase domain-containing 5 isoform X2 [Nasonia vitripennis]